MKALSLIVLLTLSFNGFTKEGGNGGGVHVCGNSYELYDFYEGRSETGHNIKLWKNDRAISQYGYITLALDHIKRDIPQVHVDVNNMIAKIMATPDEQLFANISIPVIQDATTTIIGEGCHYEQAANWNERFNKLFISKRIFDKLDGLNKAGLIVHEAIYKLSRETKVATETSDAVREVVARIFSDEVLTEKDAEVISSAEARAKASKPQCDYARNMFREIDDLLAKGVDAAKIKKLNGDIVQMCLKYCLIPEDRSFCESRRN